MVTGAQRRRSGALQTPPAAEDGPLELGGQRKRAPPLRTPGHIYGRAAAAEPAAPRRSASHGPRTAPPLGAHSRAPVAITSGPRSRPRVAGGGSLAARPSATLAFGRRVPQDPPHAASRRGADATTPSPARNFGLPAAAAAGGAHPPIERLLRARRQRNTGGASSASRSFMSTGAAARPQRRESSHTHAPRGAAESNPTASALSPVSSELTPSRRLEGALSRKLALILHTAPLSGHAFAPAWLCSTHAGPSSVPLLARLRRLRCVAHWPTTANGCSRRHPWPRLCRPLRRVRRQQHAPRRVQ